MKAKIHVYPDAAGEYRWNVAVLVKKTSEAEKWDIVCQCTNTHKTEKDAEEEAVRVICQAWDVE